MYQKILILWNMIFNRQNRYLPFIPHRWANGEIHLTLFIKDHSFPTKIIGFCYDKNHNLRVISNFYYCLNLNNYESLMKDIMEDEKIAEKLESELNCEIEIFSIISNAQEIKKAGPFYEHK